MAAAHALHPPARLPRPLPLLLLLQRLPSLLRVVALSCCCRGELQLPLQVPLLLLLFVTRLMDWHWLQFVHLLLLPLAAPQAMRQPSWASLLPRLLQLLLGLPW